jgi:hypothetical protein
MMRHINLEMAAAAQPPLGRTIIQNVSRPLDEATASAPDRAPDPEEAADGQRL